MARARIETETIKTVVLELTVEEAQDLRNALGNISEKGTYVIYDILDEALREGAL